MIDKILTADHANMLDSAQRDLADAQELCEKCERCGIETGDYAQVIKQLREQADAIRREFLPPLGSVK